MIGEDMTRKEREPNEGFKFTEEDLIILRDELYDGSWELFLQDLRNRLEKRPAVYKITERIKEDIERIEDIMSSEKKSKTKTKS